MDMSSGDRQGIDFIRDVFGLSRFEGPVRTIGDGARASQSTSYPIVAFEGRPISVRSGDATARTGGHA